MNGTTAVNNNYVPILSVIDRQIDVSINCSHDDNLPGGFVSPKRTSSMNVYRNCSRLWNVRYERNQFSSKNSPYTTQSRPWTWCKQILRPPSILFSEILEKGNKFGNLHVNVKYSEEKKI
jgi:hypothetical protein